LVWGSQAKHSRSTVSPKWEQTLEDGKVVRLIGITRTDKWLYCWWDGDGQPIENHDWISLTKFYENQSIMFSAEVAGPAAEWKKQTPTGHPGANRGEPAGPFSTSISNVAEKNGQATVGVAVGPWEPIGEIKKGGRIKVGNVTYILRAIQSNGPDSMFVEFFPERYVPDQNNIVTLSAVALDGTEVDPNYLPAITGKNFGVSPPNFQGFLLKNLKTFHVWKRKQQWVTFKGFATQPLTSPKDQVTAAELAAAVDLQNKSQQQIQVQTAQQQLETTQAKRKEWDAIPPDPKTPKGAIRLMFQLAANGDLNGVRARMTATQPDAGPTIDAAARFMTDMERARHLAVARFGETNVDSLQTTNPEGLGAMVKFDTEMEMAEQAWQPRSDGGLEVNDLNIAKGKNGEYFFDLSASIAKSNSLDRPAAVTMALGAAARLERLNQLIENTPSLTFEQFRVALDQPITQPTTQNSTTQTAH
jgi:hypothetical protein